MSYSKDKRYKIWLIEVWSDLGAVYTQPMAVSCKPAQWFADLFKHTAGDTTEIREFTTNLKETDPRQWRTCQVTTGDYHDNEQAALSVSDVGCGGNTPVITAKPVIITVWDDKEQTYMPDIQVWFSGFEEAEGE